MVKYVLWRKIIEKICKREDLNRNGKLEREMIKTLGIITPQN